MADTAALRFELPDGTRAGALPLGPDGAGQDAYATLCTALHDELDPSEPIRLPFGDAASLALVLKWIEHVWRVLTGREVVSHVAEERWRAEFMALATGSANRRRCCAPLLCSTLRLADFLGVDGLQQVLTEALASACDTEEAVAALLGAAPEDTEELQARVDTVADLAPPPLAGSRPAFAGTQRAFVMAAQSGAAACLSDNVVAAVAVRIPVTTSGEEVLNKLVDFGKAPTDWGAFVQLNNEAGEVIAEVIAEAGRSVRFFCRESFTLMTVDTLVKAEVEALPLTPAELSEMDRLEARQFGKEHFGQKGVGAEQLKGWEQLRYKELKAKHADASDLGSVKHYVATAAEGGDVVEIDGPGVYDLQCRHTKHKLQVRIQDTLGLQKLMPARECQQEGDWVKFSGGHGASHLTTVPGTVGLDFQAKEHLFGTKLYAVCAVYHVLEALLKHTGESPSVRLYRREDLPRPPQAPSTPHIEYLQSDAPMLELLLNKLPCLIRKGDVLQLPGGLSDENKRLLSQAKVEVKMLVVSYVCTWGTDPHFEELTMMMQFLNTSGFPGTVRGTFRCGPDDPNEVYLRNDESIQALSTLVCGIGNISSTSASWNNLKQVRAKLIKLASEDPDCLSLETLTLVSPLSTPMTVEMALEFKTAEVDLMFAFTTRKLKEPASRSLTERAFEDLAAVLDVEFRKPDKALLAFTRGAAGSGRGELKELIAFSAKAIKDLTKKLTAANHLAHSIRSELLQLGFHMNHINEIMGKRIFNSVQEAVDALAGIPLTQ